MASLVDEADRFREVLVELPDQSPHVAKLALLKDLKNLSIALFYRCVIEAI